MTMSMTKIEMTCIWAGDGIVVKGQAYGIPSIRVDGNDALAIYNVVRSARQIAINEQRPILIEVNIHAIINTHIHLLIS